MLMGIWFIFTVTFTVFLGAFLKAPFNFMDSWSDADSWSNLFYNILFNVSDTVGRKLGAKYNLSDKTVPFLTLTRLVFIPTTLLIAIYAKKEDGGFLKQDWFKIVNMVLFAISNGYLSTQCAIKAPSMVNDEQKMQIGMFVSIFLCLGITSGSFLAIPVGAALPD